MVFLLFMVDEPVDARPKTIDLMLDCGKKLLTQRKREIARRQIMQASHPQITVI
jgi:hypothetical protein